MKKGSGRRAVDNGHLAGASGRKPEEPGQNEAARLPSLYCNYCHATRIHYRTDYPKTDPRAYFIQHAAGCRTKWDDKAKQIPAESPQRAWRQI